MDFSYIPSLDWLSVPTPPYSWPHTSFLFNPFFNFISHMSYHPPHDSTIHPITLSPPHAYTTCPMLLPPTPMFLLLTPMFLLLTPCLPTLPPFFYYLPPRLETSFVPSFQVSWPLHTLTTTKKGRKKNSQHIEIRSYEAREMVHQFKALLLLQDTWVLFLEPTWRFTTIYNYSFGASNVYFWPSKSPQYIYIHEDKHSHT